MQGAFGPHTPDQLDQMPDNDAVTDVALVLGPRRFGQIKDLK